MMSLEQIDRVNREAAAQAATRGHRPFVMTEKDWRVDLASAKRNNKPWSLSQLPHLGDLSDLDNLYPGEWESVESFFVDATGWDLWDAGGPANSVGQLITKALALTEEHGSLGWFVGDAGQFQLTVFAVRRVGGNGRAQ